MNQLQSTPVEIGGATFQISLLPFEAARPAYVRLQRLLQANEEILSTADIGLFMFAGMTGQLDDEDLKYYIDLFAECTTVTLGQQTLFLKQPAARTALFSGRMENLFQWLDAACEVNFASAREKLVAARKRLAANQAAKAEPKT